MESIGNLTNNVKSVPISVLSRLFNIGASQWPRVTECWFITLFFKIGSAIGFTILTASFVGQFGIKWLPVLFVINASLTIISTYFFEKLIMRVKREILMILMLIASGISLFLASFVYGRSVIGFFGLVIFAESVFLAQFYVFLPILVGDRFTPLESQSTFPFIESAENVGGILGGVIVGLLAEHLPITVFLYIWMICLICIIFVFIITSSVRMSLPPLPFRISSKSSREQSPDQVKLVLSSIKKMPFVKGLIIIVLVQWVFMNLLEFQYMKSLQQSITHNVEPTIAHQVDGSLLHASVLTSKGSATVSATPPTAVTPPHLEEQRALSEEHQTALTKKLGQFKGLFSASALVVQMIFASRLITSLGVVGSLILHPVIVLMSLVGMFLKFGFASSAVTKLSFEVTSIVHKNAYFTSHYAMPKTIRDQAAEFLEGIVRPMGTIVSMLLILGMQFIFVGRDLTTIIHSMMFITMGIILITTIKLKPKYTHITKDQLFSDIPYTEQINAIEILEQKGHANVTRIFVDKLAEISQNSSHESNVIRMRIISALGKAQDYSSLPEILDALNDPDADIRLEAAHALMNFKNIGEHFYAQAFSRFRMIEILKDLFRTEQSAAVRNAIIRVFSLIREPAIVSFLLDVLRDSSADVRADCVYTLGLFHDPNSAYYVLPFVQDENPFVRANAIVALWQFHKYHLALNKQLSEMLQSVDKEEVRAGIFALGEIGLLWNHILLNCLSSEEKHIRFEAALSLLKCSNPRGFSELVSQIFASTREEFDRIRRVFARLKPNARSLLEQLLAHFIPGYLNDLARDNEGLSLEEMNPVHLEQLRRLYTLLDQHEELFTIERALAAVPLQASV